MVRAQMAGVSDLSTAGMDAGRLERLDHFLHNQVDEGRIPGVVYLVSRQGQLAVHESYGYNDVENKSSIGNDAIFQIMSMTKPVISVAFMMLYEEGHFLLTDPVSRYLPRFRELRVAKDPAMGMETETEPLKSEITIHQLLTHTAGFTHGLGSTKLDSESAKALYLSPQESIETRVNTLLDLPMVGQPGEQWAYSAAPDVLALLVEHFSGQTVEEFLKQRIFDPLGMTDTGYNVPEGKRHRVVLVHNLDEEGKLVKSKEQFPLEGNKVFGGTHGLFTTAEDYLKFCQMLLNGGSSDGHRLLSPKTVELMTMDHVGDFYNAPGQGFGLGFGITTDVAKSKSAGSVGQFYWGGAWCTYFFVDPQTEMIAVVLTQFQPYTNFYGDKMRQLVYQALID
jgi:CubicO group peptidase (beta-lactamase class C family)